MPAALKEWKVQPHGPLEQIDDGILTVEGEIVMPLGRFPRRMTVVALADGGTLIWSAIALREPEMARIEALGAPHFLVVPNRAHRLDSRIWKARYPQIRVLTPPSARQVVEEVVPVDATRDIVADPRVTFDLLDQKEQEFALRVQRPSGTTLLVNDAIAHVRHPHGLGAKIMARLMGFGIHGPQVPRVVRRMMISDPAALAAQIREWAEIPNLERIIVSHGDPIETDPAGELRRLAARLSS